MSYNSLLPQAPATSGSFETIDTSGNILNGTTTTPFIYSPVVFGRYLLSSSGPARPTVARVGAVSSAEALPVGSMYPPVGR